jgi:chromosome transmission fidelity protein 18
LAVKRDFFGRPVAVPEPGSLEDEKAKKKEREKVAGEQRVWITYHEGFSNAVRKPITLAELMKDL